MDSNTRPEAPATGIEALKRHASRYMLDVCMWAIRGVSILLTFAYFVPIFGNPYNAYYRVLLANAAINAIRLHQRLPQPSLSKEFFIQLFSEDSCHYLLYSLIFLYVQPVALVLCPVFLFVLIHFTSYSLTLLDILGQNSWWVARILISLIEFQTRNILRLIAFTEIFLMPFVVMLLFLSRAGLFTPFVYFQFLTLRYSSRRNPHTRLMFRELRQAAENFASKPSMPDVLRTLILSSINIICKLAPRVEQQQQQ